MKLTDLLVAIAIACTITGLVGMGVSCKSPSQAPQNLAVLLVTSTIDTDAKCTPYFTDAGDAHVHSAECRMPNKARVYCTISTTASPKCETIVDAPKPPGAAEAQKPAPAPAPTPSSPPAEAPPKAP